MSRNVRQKPVGSKTGKKSVKRSKNSIASDDSDYSGVDLISDSEEDEPDVEVAEEQAIIESEEEEDYASPQPVQDDDQDSWANFDVFEDNPGVYFEEQIAQIVRPTVPDIFTGATGWIADAGSDDESQPETARRVRFDLSSDSDTAPSDVEDNIFPDIFLEQGSLDPGFRRTIENDHDKDNDDPPSDDGSYWDFRGDDAEVEDEDPNMDNQSETSCESSGYETDEGETTEEDLPPAAKFLPARTVLRRQSNDSSSSEEDIQVIRRNPYRQPQRSGPKLGSWVTDASKPFAVLDSRGKKLMMFRARISRRHSMNSSSGRPVPRAYMEEDDHDVNGMEQMSPMISNSANLMMSAMYTPMDNLGGHALGPPEAFYPFVSIAANGNVTQDCPSSSFDEDDVDDDDLWNIADLVDFGDDTSSEDGNNEEDEDSCDSATAGHPSSTPRRPSTANSEDQTHSLLNHLNSGIVGAFRRNQTRHQLLSRNSASRESLAFSGRYGNGAIRGIKGGRLAAANTPITPLRKRKTTRADPISPSPADGDKKRKFSGEARGHKRVRSLF